jgi:chromosome segregation ATPase
VAEPKSYLLTEAAELTGLSVPALRKRIVRKTLRGFRSNEDGLWRVWLASDDIEAAKASQSDRPDTGQSTARPVDENRTIKALEGEAAALREALERERRRADAAEAGQAEAHQQAHGARIQMDEARQQAQEASIRAAVAEQEAKGLRELLEEARKPFWRRWIG